MSTMTTGAYQDAADLAEQAQAAESKPAIAALIKRLLAIESRFPADSIDRAVCQRRLGSLGMFQQDPDIDDLDGADLIDWTGEVERLESHLVPDALSRFIAGAAADCIEARS